MSDDDLDLLSDVSVNDLITQTKLAGSLLVLKGWTTPEGWPFAVVVTIDRPEDNGRIAQAVIKLQEAALEVVPLAAATVRKAWP
jgi:hypothetical protein